MCKFCEAMETFRKVDIFKKERWPDEEYRYSVAIVRRLFTKGRKSSLATQTDYRYRGFGYVLNFCPECGRKITKNSAIDVPPKST